MKDIVTPVPPEEVKGVIRKCLEQAAQLNYQRINEYAKIEGKHNNTTQHRIMTAGVNVLMIGYIGHWNVSCSVGTVMLSRWLCGVKVEKQRTEQTFPCGPFSLVLHCYLFVYTWWPHLVYGIFVSISQMICGIPNYLWQLCWSLSVSQSNNSLLCFRPALALCCSVGQVGFCVEVCE